MRMSRTFRRQRRQKVKKTHTRFHRKTYKSTLRKVGGEGGVGDILKTLGEFFGYTSNGSETKGEEDGNGSETKGEEDGNGSETKGEEDGEEDGNGSETKGEEDGNGSEISGDKDVSNSKTMDVGNTETPNIQEELNQANEIHRTYKPSTTNFWIQNFLENPNYQVIDNTGKGDCFFITIQDAFNGEKPYKVQNLRNMLAEHANEDIYSRYRGLFDSSTNSIKENDSKIQQLTKKIVIFGNKKNNTIEDVSKAQQINEEEEIAELKKENKNSEEFLKEFQFMKGVNSLEDLKNIIRSNVFWANQWAIETLERLLNIKMIIIDYENHTGKIMCNTDQTEEFSPNYYIMVELNSEHYRLVTYDGGKKFKFNQLPFDLKKMIVNTCMTNSGGFSLIPEFQNFKKELNKLEGKVNEDGVEGNEIVINGKKNKIYNDHFKKDEVEDGLKQNNSISLLPPKVEEPINEKVEKLIKEQKEQHTLKITGQEISNLIWEEIAFKESIDISNSTFQDNSVSIPDQIFPNLTTLKISNNKISSVSIPPSNKNFPNLKRLYLSHNKLSEININLNKDNFPELKYIMLQDNNLTNEDLSKIIADLTTFHPDKDIPVNPGEELQLNISNNRLLTELPTTINNNHIKIIGEYTVLVPKYFYFGIQTNIPNLKINMPDTYYCNPFIDIPDINHDYHNNYHNINNNNIPIKNINTYNVKEWIDILSETKVSEQAIFDTRSVLEKNLSNLITKIFPTNKVLDIQNENYTIYNAVLDFPKKWEIISTTNPNNPNTPQHTYEIPITKLLPPHKEQKLINKEEPPKITQDLFFKIPIYLTLYKGNKINWYDLPKFWCSLNEENKK